MCQNWCYDRPVPRLQLTTKQAQSSASLCRKLLATASPAPRRATWRARPVTSPTVTLSLRMYHSWGAPVTKGCQGDSIINCLAAKQRVSDALWYRNVVCISSRLTRFQSNTRESRSRIRLGNRMFVFLCWLGKPGWHKNDNCMHNHKEHGEYYSCLTRPHRSLRGVVNGAVRHDTTEKTRHGWSLGDTAAAGGLG